MTFLWRILFHFYRLLSSIWYWAYHHFTLPGRVVLGTFLASSAIAVDSENNVSYQAFVFLLFTLLIAVAFSWIFKARFSVVRCLPRCGTAGSPLSYTLLIENLSGKTQRGLAVLEELAHPRPSFEEWRVFQDSLARASRSFRVARRPRINPFHPAIFKEAALPPAMHGQKIETRLRMLPLQRGLLQFRGIRLARPDPLGIFRSLIRVPAPQSVVILPKRYPLPPIALPGTLKYQEGGVALASHVGRSDEFMALRDYRPGDSLRHVHWRSWARTGKPVVKEFEDEFFVRHALVMDTFTSVPNSEAFEEAVSVAASFACTVRTQESLLDLLFVGLQSYCFTAGRGLARSEQMLELLASVRPCTDQSFSRLERLVLNHAGAVSGIICVLVSWNAERQNFVRKLKALGIPLLLVVIVEPGQSTSLEPGPMADAPHQFHVFEAGQVEAGLAKLGSK